MVAPSTWGNFPTTARGTVSGVGSPAAGGQRADQPVMSLEYRGVGKLRARNVATVYVLPKIAQVARALGAAGAGEVQVV